MADRALIINGLPGAGKTTLAGPLGEALGLPVVSKDAIKESLADAIPTPLPTQRLGAIASDASALKRKLYSMKLVPSAMHSLNSTDASRRRTT